MLASLIVFKLLLSSVMWDSEPNSGTVNYLPLFHELMISTLCKEINLHFYLQVQVHERHTLTFQN